MDRIDLSILAALEKDARLSYGDLAAEVGLSKTPCWGRVQALEKADIIRGYHADIDPQQLGLGVLALVQVIINFDRREDFERAVLSNSAILECYTVAGEADYVLKVICRDLDGLDDLLRYTISQLPGLERSTTILCLKPIKRRGSPVAAARDLKT